MLISFGTISGAQFELENPELTVLFQEEVTIQRTRGAEEQEKWWRRYRRQRRRFRRWAENYPDVTFSDESESEEE
ncbi:hypothetical protein L226DRAFT_537139 [Lentinus tigrinus ALCF2SS1-7]|uniref:uncharacterized protein n=1 Tax=Lentinus tigrinus ALCF2SS1-7 TaxID=1328758 RepID=UPI001165E7FC|nr:hypothetical protein L226DRAFT_537139 [Lentinus tigrinus ALCF2SS1-7]